MKRWLTLISPWGGLALGLVLTSITWQNARDNAYRNHEQQFHLFAEFARAELANRLQRCEEAVASAALLFAASESVEPNEWDTLLQGLGVGERRTGLSELAFLTAADCRVRYRWRRLTAEDANRDLDLPRLFRLEQENLDAAAKLYGPIRRYQGLIAHPCPNSCSKLVLIHPAWKMEPLASESTALATPSAEIASDSSLGSISDQMRQFGWAVGIVELGHVCGSLWEKDDPALRVRLFSGDANSTRLLFDSHRDQPVIEHRPMFHRAMGMSGLNGVYWLEVASLPEYEASIDRTWPVVVFLTGLFISGLLFGLLWSAQHTRDLAEQMAEAMTQKLRNRERDLERYTAALEKANRETEAYAAKATQASKAKSMFLANTSHELRTPLTAILGYAEMLRHDDATDPQLRNEAVDAIVRGAHHLLNLIDDLLDLSRIESGAMTIHRQHCSLREILSEVRLIAQGRAETKGLRFSVEYDEQIPDDIVTDPRRVRQILINLLGNAVKFTEAGWVQLTVRQPPGTEGELEFVVEDSGIGMEPEQLGRIFQPFVQAHRHISTRYGGTGLGLSISRQLAELLGGTIVAESTPGKGSRFIVRLPTMGIGISDDQPAEASPQTVILPAELAGKRILLAEDSAENARLISRILCKAGAEVQCVSNGCEAIEALHRGPADYDLVLMDLEMPLLDGASAVCQLRSEGFSLPIVGLTAHAFDDAKQRCLEAGCDDFATKPIQRDTLLALVARWIHSAEARR